MVTALRTEFIETPVGVENPEPLLSWQLQSGRRGARQRAYRILVASSAQELEGGSPDLWDSGKVESDLTVGIPYEGVTLASRQRCFWRVAIWDETGNEVLSPIASWEMGLLQPSDWSARWLAAETRAMHEAWPSALRSVQGITGQSGEFSKFRLNFSLSQEASAAFYVVGSAALHVWIDGRTVGLPTDTQSGKPLSATLTSGRHVVAVAVEKTKVSEAFNLSNVKIAPFLRLQLADGTIQKHAFEGWKTALCDLDGWQETGFDDTSWSTAPSLPDPGPLPWPQESAILARRSFSATKMVERARIYATAFGGYELYLNGDRVGEALLAPESTDFRKRVLYRVYDVTDRILSGENVIGAMVGDGWYGSATAGAGRYPWGEPPRKLLVQLELQYADGSRDIVASNKDWRVAPAPVVSSEIYDGEYYDARLEQPGWSSATFDASAWEIATIADVPLHTALVAQIAPPIRREQSLRPRSITEVRPGTYVFDFGQNFAGWARLRVKGPGGTAIELRFAEILKSDGDIDQANLWTARATDTYILKGDPDGETFEPHFTYHGFRYVQVTGLPNAPSPDTLEGVVFHSDLPFTGKLAIDNAVIQALWRNTLWSQRSNFLGIPTDCPQRSERLGWMGDANIFWDAAAFNMDVDAFTHRFMGDVRDAQSEEGAFSDISPVTRKFAATFVTDDKNGTTIVPTDTIGASPGWADAGVCLPWTVWQRYRDTGIIEENWEAMSRYIRFLTDANPGYVWRNRRGIDYGDWLAFDAEHPADPTTPKDLIGTATWAHSVACMIEMAEATSRTAEAQQYRTLWSNIAAAFQKQFVASDGSVGNGSQTGYILALRYNLVPEHLRSAAAAKVAGDITQRGMLLSTGFLGTPNSLDVLADAGYNELVYSLLLRTEIPSWGYMIARGATTIWERWNGDTASNSSHVYSFMNSYNHYALGAVCGFLFRRIAGIAPLEPGFRKIEVRPVLDPRVKRGGAEYESVQGKITTDWEQREDGGFTLEVTVPANTTARVYLPAKPAVTILESGQPLEHSAGVAIEQRTDNEAIVGVSAGQYHFAVQ